MSSKKDKENAVAYLGSEPVLAVADSDKQTPAGDEMVEVTTKTDVELMSKRRYELLATPHSTSNEVMMEKLYGTLAQQIYALCLEYDFKLNELDGLWARLLKQVSDALTAATNHLWGINDESKRSFMKMNEVLLEAYDEKTLPGQGEDESASDGSGTDTPVKD